MLVGIRFQVLFHSPHRGSFHRSLTVLSTIGHQVIFSLGGWSPLLPTGFLVSRGTQDPTSPLPLFRLRDSHPLRFTFPCDFGYRVQGYLRGPTTPIRKSEIRRQRSELRLPISDLRPPYGFGLFPVRSPLLGESLLISSPPGTEMLHFPGFASCTYLFST